LLNELSASCALSSALLRRLKAAGSRRLVVVRRALVAREAEVRRGVERLAAVEVLRAVALLAGGIRLSSDRH
jgi:hypothetical protein